MCLIKDNQKHIHVAIHAQEDAQGLVQQHVRMIAQGHVLTVVHKGVMDVQQHVKEIVPHVQIHVQLVVMVAQVVVRIIVPQRVRVVVVDHVIVFVPLALHVVGHVVTPAKAAPVVQAVTTPVPVDHNKMNLSSQTYYSRIKSTPLSLTQM